MTDKLQVLVMGGDGIGPEVVNAARPIMESLAAEAGIRLDIEERPANGACYDLHGVFITEESKALAQSVDVILYGAEGGPKWDYLNIPGPLEDKSALSWLRKYLDLYFNLRPAKPLPSLLDSSSLKPSVLEGVDIMVVRELCGGIYFGNPRGIETTPAGKRRGFDTQSYDEDEIARVARGSFELARTRRRHLSSFDKANVMESSVLWREVVSEIGRDEFPDVRLDHFYCDNGLYQIARYPGQFDVVVADNLFGDLVSDVAAVCAGSLGMLPSASLGPIRTNGRRMALYEPVHGSAPDIAGKGIANPIGAILSVAMMAELSFKRRDLAQRVEHAVDTTLSEGVRPRDLGGQATTAEMTEAIRRRLEA